jgi:hypothetical protein
VITRPGSPAVLVRRAGAAARTTPTTETASTSAHRRAGSFQKVDPQGAINPREIGNTTFAYSAGGERLYAVVQSTVLMTAPGTKAANTVLAGVYRSNSGSLAGRGRWWRTPRSWRRTARR